MPDNLALLRMRPKTVTKSSTNSTWSAQEKSSVAWSKPIVCPHMILYGPPGIEIVASFCDRRNR